MAHVKTLDWDTILIDYSVNGILCVRLPSDPELDSSLPPSIQTILLESDELAEVVDREIEDHIDELDFDDE